jgi:hypothetical protein
MPAALGAFVLGGFMRFVLIALFALYLLLAFIGCLDRQMTVRSADGKEIHEDNKETNRGGNAGSGGNRVGLVGSRMAASRDSGVCSADRLRADP